MDTIIGTAQQGAEQVRELVMWLTGLTGGTSLVAVIVMFMVGSAIIKTIARILLIVAILAVGVWAYLYFGLDAYFDILSIIGLG